MSDILHSLRQRDFPDNTQLALRHVCACFAPGDSGIPGFGGTSEDLAAELIEDYIFCRYTGKGKPKKLTPIEELQVLEIMVELYKNTENEIVRHSLFKALFSQGSANRADFVCRLISLALAVQCAQILESAAVWMQIQGCSSTIVTQVARTLVTDYCTKLPGALDTLHTLPRLSTHFTCNFITAVTAMYPPPGTKTVKDLVPMPLLEMMSEWIAADPQLCLISLCQTQSPYLQPQRTTLWTSPTKPNTQTPIPGLVRWCTKSPLLTVVARHELNNSVKNSDSTKSDKSAQSRKNNWTKSVHDMERLFVLWSQLHLAILQTLSSLPLIPGASQLELITLSDMQRLVKDVTGIIKLVPGGMEVEEVHTAIERLVQVLQISLATGGFRCSLSDLRNICQSIPSNRLLDFVKSQHLSTAPPQMHNAK